MARELVDAFPADPRAAADREHIVSVEAVPSRSATLRRSGTGSQAEWFGQPRGLAILFLTDMWEQFSYYGMRALLVYYMVEQRLMGQQRASLTYGLYTAFVYFTPIIGGLISDRSLGRRRSVLLGGSIMALGHFMMAFESLFYVALATIACGNGLFLPNLPGQIDGLYEVDDPRRKSAYNIFYVGINLGGFLAPFVCGTIGEAYGWHWGFTVAGIGMVLGLMTYILGGHHLPADEPGARVVNMLPRPAPNACASGERRELLRRFALLAGIAVVAVILRSGYEQIGNTVALWIETADRSVGGFIIPMTWFMSINPLLVMLMTPWLVAHWVRRAKHGKEPSSIVKMATGAAIIAASYLILAGAAAWTEAHGTHAGWLWLLAFFAMMTLGELYVLPIGLGLFGRLAPRGFTGTAIALWFFAAFAGNLLAGALGTLWSRLMPSVFFLLAAFVIGLAAALMLLFNRAIERAEMD